jgi:hypothetical protein
MFADSLNLFDVNSKHLVSKTDIEITATTLANGRVVVEESGFDHCVPNRLAELVVAGHMSFLQSEV